MLARSGRPGARLPEHLLLRGQCDLPAARRQAPRSAGRSAGCRGHREHEAGDFRFALSLVVAALLLSLFPPLQLDPKRPPPTSSPPRRPRGLIPAAASPVSLPSGRSHTDSFPRPAAGLPFRPCPPSHRSRFHSHIRPDLPPHCPGRNLAFVRRPRPTEGSAAPIPHSALPVQGRGPPLRGLIMKATTFQRDPQGPHYPSPGPFGQHPVGHRNAAPSSFKMQYLQEQPTPKDTESLLPRESRYGREGGHPPPPAPRSPAPPPRSSPVNCRGRNPSLALSSNGIKRPPPRDRGESLLPTSITPEI